MAGCSEWVQGSRARDYGGVRVDGEMWLAHRWVWVEANGPIPPGLCVLHSCDNPRCVNLDHLFLGTQQENMADMVSKGRHGNQKKTHCKNGHPLSGDNLYVCPRGRRECRTCRAEASRAYEARLVGSR